MNHLEAALALIDVATAERPDLRSAIRDHLSLYLESLDDDYEIDFSLDDSN